MQEGTFLLNFPHNITYMKTKKFFKIFHSNFSENILARKTRNATRWSAMSPGHTTLKKSAAGAGRSYF